MRSSGTAVFLCSALILLCLLLYLLHKQYQKDSAAQLYLLLDHFTDAALFHYHCGKDILSFTPNTPMLLKIKLTEQKNFLHSFTCPFVCPEDRETLRLLLSGNAKEAGPDEQEVQLRFFHSDGSLFWGLVQFQYLYENGTLVSVIGKITDVDRQIRHENFLVRVSETDGLTGLNNRSATEQKVTLRLSQFSSGAFFLFDIDDFKSVNDSFGHAIGDNALYLTAESMRKVFRTEDILGRIGGDEFIVFAPDLCDLNVARKKIELLQKHLEKAEELHIPALSISTGIAMYPEDGLTYQTLYRTADIAMYKAKQQGKKRICSSED